MKWDPTKGKSREFKGSRRTPSFPGRTLGVVSFLLMATMGCSLLQGGQARRPQGQGQVSPPSTASAAGAGPSIVLCTATGAPGQDVTLVATLRSAGTHVAGTENDLTFDAVNLSIATRGKPSCRANAAIGKGATAFAARPNGCQGTACTTVRALVFSMDNSDLIPDGAALYTCTLHISPSAPPGQYRIKTGGVTLSTPAGQKVPNASGSDGVLIVSATKTH